MVLGVTGGIACGKSLVSDCFAELGAAVVSADQLARDVVAPGSATLNALVAKFGAEILAEDALDRDALAAIVFADPASRTELERITHPAIKALAERRLRELRERDVPLVVYEAPLLFEAGAEGRVDKVLVVTLPPEVQLQRLMARSGLDRAAAAARVAAQMSQQEKVARADYVIDNSGSPEQLHEAVAQLYRQLVG